MDKKSVFTIYQRRKGFNEWKSIVFNYISDLRECKIRVRYPFYTRARRDGCP